MCDRTARLDGTVKIPSGGAPEWLKGAIWKSISAGPQRCVPFFWHVRRTCETRCLAVPWMGTGVGPKFRHQTVWSGQGERPPSGYAGRVAQTKRWTCPLSTIRTYSPEHALCASFVWKITTSTRKRRAKNRPALIKMIVGKRFTFIAIFAGSEAYNPEVATYRETWTY